MTQLRARILSNLVLPAVEGFPIRTFQDYLPEGSCRQDWRAERERRNLASILPLIPKAEQPDILVVASPEYLPIPVDIASFPGLKILLITDWNVCLRFLPDLCPLFDFCFTDWPGYRLLKRAGIANIRHQPLFGHDPEQFRVTGKERDLDVSFCGNLNSGLHGERNRLLARLARWGARRPDRPVHLRQAFGAAYVDVLNRSRLVFNYSIRGEANMRLYESMAAGAVPLVEESNQEVGILFQEGKHYFKYASDRLEDRLDDLLSDPARLESASAEARVAVARHTKALQLQALFTTACREAPAVKREGQETPSGHKAMVGPGTDRDALAALKALIKLRILGAGFTLTESLEEIHSRSAECPGLDIETVPAALLTLLAQNAAGALAAAERMTEQYVDGSALPEILRAFFAMKLATHRGGWRDAIGHADRCLTLLDALSPDPESVRPLYGFFYPPLDLGKGFNTDLNAAFREDMAGGKPQGYLDLLRAHCCADKARAFHSLGLFRESADQMACVPLTRFASLDPYAFLLPTLFRLGDMEGAKSAVRTWLGQKPLDTGAWDKAFETYGLIGDKPALIGFLEEISLLSETFLDKGQSDLIRGMLERERG